MDDDQLDRLFRRPATWTGDQERIALYGRALKKAWLQDPNNETYNRFNGFVRSPRLSRLTWIEWVERNAETIPGAAIWSQQP